MIETKSLIEQAAQPEATSTISKSEAIKGAKRGKKAA